MLYGLQHCTKLTSLELKEVFACKRNLEGLHFVAAALHHMPCMQRFVLDEQRIHATTPQATASSLSAGLAALSQLTELTIVGVNMDVEASRCGPVLSLTQHAVVSAAEALLYKPAGIVLSEICNSLPTNQNFFYLTVPAASCRALVSGLSRLEKLRMLCLSRCGLQDGSIHAVAEQLQHLSNLRRLDMSRNAMKAEGSERVVTVGAPPVYVPVLYG